MKRIFLILVSVLFLLALPVQTYAARLYLLPVRTHAQQGKDFTVELRLDTQGDVINALDVRVRFPPDILMYDSASDASSLVNIWMERPRLMPDASDVVTMSGVAPGGFIGDGLVTRLTFRGTRSGDAAVSITSDSKVVLDRSDGKLSFVVPGNAQVSVTQTALGPESIAIASGSPVEIATTLARTPYAYDNKWFVSFVAQDKHSGIKEYQVRERFLGIFGGEWKSAESPYVLKSQNLLSTITVQAVTFTGVNSQVTVVPSRLKVLYGIVLAVIFSVGLVAVLKKLIMGLPRME